MFSGQIRGKTSYITKIHLDNVKSFCVRRKNNGIFCSSARFSSRRFCVGVRNKGTNRKHKEQKQIHPLQKLI